MKTVYFASLLALLLFAACFGELKEYGDADQPCFNENRCNPGLTCVGGVCRSITDGDQDGDDSTDTDDVVDETTDTDNAADSDETVDTDDAADGDDDGVEEEGELSDFCQTLCQGHCNDYNGCTCPDCGTGATCDAVFKVCLPLATCTDATDCGDDPCGSWGDCNYENVCDREATKTRSCYRMDCELLACIVTEQYQDTEACNRNTEWLTCGEDVCGPEGPCEWDDDCVTDGKICQSCDTFRCDAAGVCRKNENTSSCRQGECPRSTEGLSCMITSDGSSEGGVCHEELCAADSSDPATWIAADNLEWQVHSPGRMTQPEGETYCAGLGSGWRLPTITELRSIVRGCPAVECSRDMTACGACGINDDCVSYGPPSCRNDACDGCSWGGGGDNGCYWPSQLRGVCSFYWSSSSVDNEEYFYWHIDYSDAGVSNVSESSSLYVRCVREITG